MVIDYLKQNNYNCIVPWLSLPFGLTVGFGIYKAEGAIQLQERCNRENWSFPIFGRVYSKEKLEQKLLSR